ncbi:hypothetical protein RRG08_032609 [Elysia crispata]|uniref:Uncharacterized protein n=1 Tax=Elysia crispata TaxID=231223 RepID=A0AAE1CQ80_9GAST|nr:hypothetical protein RRG08_032609 [Elysia crispata]
MPILLILFSVDEAPRDASLNKKASEKHPLPVDALIDKTNKMDLSGYGKKTSCESTEKKNRPTQETKGRRGKKRALSKADNSEFEITNSQEYETSRKKASTVHKDLAV